MTALSSIEYFTSALTTRLVRTSPVTTVDAKHALDIYDPNVVVLKGKITRTKPIPVITKSIIPVPQDTPQLYKSVTVCSDFFYFDGSVFFCPVSRKLYYGTTQFVEDRKNNTKRLFIKHLYNTYTNRGFNLEHMLTDFEFEFIRVETAFLGIRLDTTSASQHVGHIECFICVLKEYIHGLSTLR